MTLHPITTRFDRFDAADRRDTSTAPMLYAGGTDIIPLTRSGILDAPDLVDIKSSGLSATIIDDDDEWSVGALVTLSELEQHADICAAIPAIEQALSQVATRQIRNRATVGGNLLQRPRCSYFRDGDVDCWMKGGSTCPAREGRNEHLALDGEHCVAPQPSDLAALLVALDAEVSIVDGDADFDVAAEARRVPVADFLIAPRPDHRSLNALRDGEVITHIHIPRPSGTGSSDASTGDSRTTSVYLKAMDRAVWQFALVGLAAVVTTDTAGVVTDARLCASGVSNTPLRLDVAAAELVGGTLTDEAIERAAARATRGLPSLSENSYKISLLRGLVVRSLSQVAS